MNYIYTQGNNNHSVRSNWKSPPSAAGPAPSGSRYQNKPQQQNPVYLRKPINYVDQYTNDRIPLNYNQYIQQPSIERLHEESNPSQFMNNPEMTTNDLFLRNQVPNSDEAVMKQKIDNEWNIRTQLVTINIDSRARDFLTTDYENFLEDDRNEVSKQGMWLSSYIFPNNFRINFNKQYANIKTVTLTSATFPNTRSRTHMYIDDTNNYFYVNMVMKCPWLSFNFHIDQSTNLFDFQSFMFSVSQAYINLYRFFQEIEKPYGIPRPHIVDRTINNYQTTIADGFLFKYQFGEWNNTEDWFWNGERKYDISVNNINNVQLSAITPSSIVFDNGNNFECEFKPTEVTTLTSHDGKSYYNVFTNEHYVMHTWIDMTQTYFYLYTSYDITFTHTFPEVITIALVRDFPEDYEENFVYILGTLQGSTEEVPIPPEYSTEPIPGVAPILFRNQLLYHESPVIIPAENIIQNGLTISCSRETFVQLRGYSYTIHYTFIVSVSDEEKYTIPFDVTYPIEYTNMSPAMITGSVKDIESADDANYFLMNGTLDGQLYFNADVSNMICAAFNLSWMSENGAHVDTLQGYTTGIPLPSVEFGWSTFCPVGGLANYWTLSAGVLNNINFYTEFDESQGNENTKYYGTYLQGVPNIIGNSLTHTAQYVTRAIETYFRDHGLDYQTFQWDYTNGLFMSGETRTRIEIPYGEYTLDELIDIISEQSVKVKSVQNIITSYQGFDYIENTKDGSRYYFFTVVNFQCKLKVSTEYYKNSYLLKFEVDENSIQPLQEEITISAMGYNHTFMPTTVMYDIVCLNVYEYQVTGEIILQNFFTLEPFTFHQETNPDISHVVTVKNPEYPRYNYAYNVKEVIQNDALTWVTFFPASVMMYQDEFVFPVNCSIRITPNVTTYKDVITGEIKNYFTLFGIYPPLPEGFTLEGSTITGSSPTPFQSIHYVYFYYYAGTIFRYYQSIKLINAGFMYNYSTVKLLNGFNFKGIEQCKMDSKIIAPPFTNISVSLDKNWCDLADETSVHANNIIGIGDGISVGYLTGDIYGTPQSEFQMTVYLRGEFNWDYFRHTISNPEEGTFTVWDPEGVELSETNKYIQETSIDLYSVNADLFYGDNSFMIYSYNYITDPTNDIPQFVCWAKPIKNNICNFLSFHISADDIISRKLLDELHFSYTNSKDLVNTRYLYEHYKPTQVMTMEQTQLPSIRSWTTSNYTEDIINKQYENTTLLNSYAIAENAVIYPLRELTFGYAAPNTRDINVYGYDYPIDNLFNPSANNLLSRIWYALPGYVKNELNGYIFSQHYVTNWITSAIVDDKEFKLYYPVDSYNIEPITTEGNIFNPTATRFANILDLSVALTPNINSNNVNLYEYCLYNRCRMEWDTIYEPVNLNKTLYDGITVTSEYDNNNLVGIQIASKINKLQPIVDEILTEYDYYNFEDFIWIQIYSDNYGEFENIFDPLTNRWYFAKIFFKRCEKRNDVSFNYFECPPYLCKNLNYIQELNALQVRIYDKYGNLYSDYNSTHYNFSFTLDVEYFIDDIRANGLSSRRPTQDNVAYSEELTSMQRIAGRK